MYTYRHPLCLHEGMPVAGQQHRGVGREVAVAAVLRPLDDEVGRGEVGGQGSGGAEGIDALCDQGAELGFHGDVVSRFNGPALYVSAMKGRVGGGRWHILVPPVQIGRASGGERGWQYVWISVGAGYLK